VWVEISDCSISLQSREARNDQGTLTAARGGRHPVMGIEGDRPLARAFEALFQSPQSIEYAVVDAFVGENSKGNPAAVVLLSDWKDNNWLQDVAAEFNLSLTAYIVKREKEVVERERVGAEMEERNGQTEDRIGDSDTKGEPQHVIHEFDLRWFTPTNEVNLCGHATLASAHLLYHSGAVSKRDTIFFHTNGGLLSTRSVGPEESDSHNDASEGKKAPTVEFVELNFPWRTTTPSAVSAVEALADTLRNVKIVAVGKSANFLIVELESSDDVDKLQPNMLELFNSDSNGLIATAQAGKASGFDFVSRCFFPKLGVDEVQDQSFAFSKRNQWISDGSLLSKVELIFSNIFLTISCPINAL
jgi:predicted PhzF superfamily epimerase YddE/YHI9